MAFAYLGAAQDTAQKQGICSETSTTSQAGGFMTNLQDCLSEAVLYLPPTYTEPPYSGKQKIEGRKRKRKALGPAPSPDCMLCPVTLGGETQMVSGSEHNMVQRSCSPSCVF